jgi:Tol biopolymer transport system component
MGMEDSPVISPNGVMVLYSTERNKNDTNRVLASISIDGHFSSYLPIPGSGSIKNPAWSPFLD